MIFVTFDELRLHLELDNLSNGVIGEAFDALVNHEHHHYLFTNTKEYREKSVEYASKQGWDLETTLVLYDLPKVDDPEDGPPTIRDATVVGDIDWDDIQIGIVDPEQILCSFFPNTTLDKMVSVVNSYGRMKAFL